MSEYTSICFNGIEFTNFVLFAKAMVSKDKSKYSKLALLHVEDNRLVCRTIDDNSNYIEYYVELFESDNLITEYFAVSITDFMALIKCANSCKFTIRKKFTQYEFNVIGNSWVPFNTADVDESKYALSGEFTSLGMVDSLKLKDAISSVINYTQDYTYVQDRYLVFNKDYMMATSRSSHVIINGNFVDMVLSRDNAIQLKSLIKDSFALTIGTIKSVIEKTVFIGHNFKFIVNKSDISTNNKNVITEFNNYIKVDCADLYKLVMFAEEYTASKHTIGLSVKNKQLNISVKNVLAANHCSTINTEAVGEIENVQETIISTHNMLKAIKVFQDKRVPNINIYLTNDMINNENCIVMFDDNTQAIINIYNR